VFKARSGNLTLHDFIDRKTAVCLLCIFRLHGFGFVNIHVVLEAKEILLAICEVVGLQIVSVSLKTLGELG